VATEGELTVRLAWDGRRVRQVTVRSTRPFAATRVLTGKTAAEAAATVPLLFSICGGAQGAAAAGALGAAGAAGLAAEGTTRDTRLLLESLQEGFWHLLIDWPNAVGSPTVTTPVAAARHRIASSARGPDGAVRWGNAAAMRELGAGLSGLAAQAIFGMPPARWLEIADLAELGTWIARGATSPATLLGRALTETPTLGACDVALMPAPRTEALLRVIAPALRHDPEFVRAPTWAGTAAETGALARRRDHPLVAALAAQYGHAVVTRIVARMAELAMLLLELAGSAPQPDALPRVQLCPLDTDEGLAAVETARGLLLHRARLHNGRVADYQIVAPTEWNFHPEGALTRGLAGLAADDRPTLARHARLAVHALDPCVACQIEVGHA
jgi:hypothetical protein